MTNPLIQSLLSIIARHGLTLVGGASFASENNVAVFVGALVALGNLAFQWYQKHQADKEAAAVKASTVSIASRIA